MDKDNPIVMKGFKLRGYHCLQDAAALSGVEYQALQRAAKNGRYRGKKYRGFRKIAGRWWVHTMTLEAMQRHYVPGHIGPTKDEPKAPKRRKRRTPKPSAKGTYTLTVDGVKTDPIKIGASVGTINKAIAKAKAMADLIAEQGENE